MFVQSNTYSLIDTNLSHLNLKKKKTSICSLWKTQPETVSAVNKHHEVCKSNIKIHISFSSR